MAGGATKVNIGTAAKTTISLLGLSVDVGTKITSPAYGSSADDGNLILGANITTGNLKIGGAQTDGDIEIGCGNDRLVAGEIRIGNGNTNAAFPITIGATNSKTDMNGSCTFAKQISASLGITSAGAITTTSGAITSASTVSGTTITASTGLVGAYQNKASSASASITTAGVITGASLGLGTGAIGCGAITSTGAISGTSLGLGTGAITCGAITASGTLTANGGLTLGSGQGITLSTTAYTPTTTQLGYTTSGTLGNVLAISSTGSNLVATSNLPIGKYIITFSATFLNFSLTTGMFLGYSFTVVGCTQGIQGEQSAGSVNVQGVSLSGFLIVTAATNSCTLRANTSGGTVDCISSGFSVIKIA